MWRETLERSGRLHDISAALEQLKRIGVRRVCWLRPNEEVRLLLWLYLLRLYLLRPNRESYSLHASHPSWCASMPRLTAACVAELTGGLFTICSHIYYGR